MTNCELLLMGFGFVMMLTVVGAMVFCWLEERHMDRLKRDVEWVEKVRKEYWPAPLINDDT